MVGETKRDKVWEKIYWVNSAQRRVNRVPEVALNDKLCLEIQA